MIDPIRFDGRAAIVTGAGNGIGRDYALALAARGAAVVVNDLGLDTSGKPLDAGSPAQQVVREITDAGGRAIACHESCATREGGAAIVATALDAFGRADILIHNAGFLRNAPFEELTDAQIDAIMGVHLMAGFYVGQPAFAAMKRQGYGRIVLTSSASGVFGLEWQANYAAAKTGLIGLTNVLALEGARHGITANALLPTGSGRLSQGAGDWPDDRFANAPDGLELIVPAMTNAFVTPMVLWLASERCKATHSVYSATGGRFARVFTGAARGWLADPAAAPTPEDIERHMGAIDDISTFDVPDNLWDELRPIIAAARARS